MKIIKRIFEKNKRAWGSKIRLSLWADRITIKKAMGKSPFELVYGSQARMSINNILCVKIYLEKNEYILEPMRERIEKLVELDDIKNEA